MSDDAQRIHKPTPKRKREFRKRGDIALSRDVVSAATLVGAVIGLFAFAGDTAASITDFTRRTALAADGTDNPALAGMAGRVFVGAAGPAVIGATVGALVAMFAQLGWPPARKKLGFDLTKLSPFANLRQVFSPGAAARRVFGALAKLGIIGAVVVVVLLGVDGLEPMSATVAAQRLSGVIAKVLLVATAAFALVAAVDYVLARRRIGAKMKMTPDEIRREHKEQEGDPTVKGQRKRKMRELARRRVSAAVKTAAVVIVNPTHYAVALRYDDKGDRAPTVVAKGVDEIAERIRELARQHGVPVLARPPLARALHKACPEGKEIPVALYRAVAEVLAYVYRLRQPRSRAS